METIEQIKADEGGYQAEVYLCTAGKLTWLYGRNIDDRPITEDEWQSLRFFLNSGLNQKHWADRLFDIEISKLISYFAGTHVFVITKIYKREVGNIILNMAYNMGVTKFNPDTWPNFFNAIKNKDYKAASIEMQYTNSKKASETNWYKQTRTRAERLTKAMGNIELCKVTLD